MSKTKIGVVSLLLAMVACNLYGQDSLDWRLYRPANASIQKDTLTGRRTVTGNVQIVQPHAIAELDSLKKLHPSPLSGFRVQIFFGDREQAQHERARFLKLYPDAGAYISYLAPNFRLRVGDFRSKIQCEAFKESLLPQFPGSYIVKDNIKLPPLILEKPLRDTPEHQVQD